MKCTPEEAKARRADALRTRAAEQKERRGKNLLVLNDWGIYRVDDLNFGVKHNNKDEGRFFSLWQDAFFYITSKILSKESDLARVESLVKKLLDRRTTLELSKPEQVL